jgi:hypothetical protein
MVNWLKLTLSKERNLETPLIEFLFINSSAIGDCRLRNYFIVETTAGSLTPGVSGYIWASSTYAAISLVASDFSKSVFSCALISRVNELIRPLLIDRESVVFSLYLLMSALTKSSLLLVSAAGFSTIWVRNWLLRSER